MIQSYEMAEKKRLELPKLQFTNNYPDLGVVSAAIEKNGIKTKIGEVNWQVYSYRPEVDLFIAYTESEILLKYCVAEKHILARYTYFNSPVYKDSCVEFFISSGNGFYYNFEFNCIGTPYVGYGAQREGRTLVEEEIVSKIRTRSTLGKKKIDIRQVSGCWELTIAIPFSLFKEAEYKNPHHHTFKANFYKCGEDLTVPHYLSWNRIGVKNPDFHRPEFFGEINFIYLRGKDEWT